MACEATTACLGVRSQPGGQWRVYAPHGLADVFSLSVRPNPVLAPRHVNQAKTVRWQHQWPSLTVLPWPAALQRRVLMRQTLNSESNHPSPAARAPSRRYGLHSSAWVPRRSVQSELATPRDRRSCQGA